MCRASSPQEERPPLCPSRRPLTALTRAAWLRPMGERKPLRRTMRLGGRAHRPSHSSNEEADPVCADDWDAYMEIK